MWCHLWHVLDIISCNWLLILFCLRHQSHSPVPKKQSKKQKEKSPDRKEKKDKRHSHKSSHKSRKEKRSHRHDWQFMCESSLTVEMKSTFKVFIDKTDWLWKCDGHTNMLIARAASWWVSMSSSIFKHFVLGQFLLQFLRNGSISIGLMFIWIKISLENRNFGQNVQSQKLQWYNIMCM